MFNYLSCLLQRWFWKFSDEDPEKKRIVQRYVVLTAGSVPELQKRIEENRDRILTFIGGVSTAAWIQPGEGFSILFVQAVILGEDEE